MQRASYSQEVVARFWMKAKPDEQGCWLWQHSKTAAGYAQADHRMGHCGLAHRIAYELVIGPIKADGHIDHLCRVRHCINPLHMEVVTLSENVMRGMSPAAINARRQDCPRGHALSGSNLYVSPSGKRGCRICRAAASRKSARRRSHRGRDNGN